MDIMEQLRDNELIRNIISSIILLVSVLLARSFALRTIRQSAISSAEVRRRWMVHVRNLAVFIFFIGILAIWASELRAVAFSFVALAVAFVIATKELILCLLGGILRGTDRPFVIGDRIEVEKYRGDVIDQTLFTTTILEIGPGQLSHQYTGRVISLPNSLFLNHPIINETFTDDYVLHVFPFPMSMQDDWKKAEQALLSAALEECKPFLEEARNYMQRLGYSQGLDAPTVDPRISVRFPEPGRVDLLVRVPVPARRKGRIEQAILRRFFNSFAGPFRGVSTE